jgi:hypothetical protein
MPVAVQTWWMCLCVVAVFNIAAWSLSAHALKRRQSRLDDEDYAERRWQLYLSAGYVFGCAFRSFFPVFDVPRQALFDTWISSALVGRTVATVAELCFAAQWALLLRETSRAANSTSAYVVSAILIPMIVVAEVCSWYSVLTTSNIGHVFEETLWGIGAALVVITMARIRPRCTPLPRMAIFAWCAAGLAYVAYMFTVDVPMYWSRWVASEAAGRPYLSISEGVTDALQRRIVTWEWADWGSEVVWMTLYFSVAVWISISLIHAPAARVSSHERNGRALSSSRPDPLRVFPAARPPASSGWAFFRR